MRQRVILVAAAWLLGAAATATAATAAVNALGAGLLGPASQPLSQSEVQRRLSVAASPGGPSAGTGASPAPTGTGSAGPAGAGPTASPPGGHDTVLGTSGGTIVARCAGGRVTLVSWSPAQGYRADDVAPEIGRAHV